MCFIVTVAACLLLQLSVSVTPSAALEILRELRGSGAIQTVKARGSIQKPTCIASPKSTAKLLMMLSHSSLIAIQLPSRVSGEV